MVSSMIKELDYSSLIIKKQLLDLCSKEVIHIGGDLSIADVMTVLWQYQMKYDPKDYLNEKRDRFVLSKGHAAAVVSFNQAMKGCFDSHDVINEYASDWGRFSMHSCKLANKYVEVSTGSLGHGMPIACGIAAGLRLKGNNTSRVYTVMGDGEQAEGSIWEAVANAKRYCLGNLVAIIDNNGLQADGWLEQLTGLGDIADKYRAFNWNVIEIDGHNLYEIVNAFDNLPKVESDIPTVIVCHTVKGKGVDFLENTVKWHAGKINDEQKERAIFQLEEAYQKRWMEI